jgi:hypothetical protein
LPRPGPSEVIALSFPIQSRRTNRSFCIYVSLSLSLSLSLCVCLSRSLSFSLSISHLFPILYFCMCVHASMYVCMYAFMQVCMYVCSCVCIYMCVCQTKRLEQTACCFAVFRDGCVRPSPRPTCSESANPAKHCGFVSTVPPALPCATSLPPSPTSTRSLPPLRRKTVDLGCELAPKGQVLVPFRLSRVYGFGGF